ncbi:MAG TPA: hypothetical protein VN213_01040, partial [Solirubrobacteraceae bacterium]|nr:hypothetical protein [Solirubrobacteraceae bacterium]
MPDVVKTVGRYEVLRDLGYGTHGRALLARHVELDRVVALEELPGVDAASAAALGRLAGEFRPGGALRHPNIVGVEDAFAADGAAYVATEVMARGSLRAYAGRLSPPQVAGALEGVLAALAHA